MAAKTNESLFADTSFASYSQDDTTTIIYLQAMVRGTRTRKQFQKLRDVYQEIFQEVEVDSRWEMTYPNTRLCLPDFDKKSRQKSQVREIMSQQSGQEFDQLSVVTDEFSGSDREADKELLLLVETPLSNSGVTADVSSMASDNGLGRRLSNTKKFTKHTMSSAMRKEINCSLDEDLPVKEACPRPAQSDSECREETSDISSASNHEKTMSTGEKGQSSSSFKSETANCGRQNPVVEEMSNHQKIPDASQSLKTRDTEAEISDKKNDIVAVSDKNLDGRNYVLKPQDIFSETIPEPVHGMSHSTPHHDLTTVSALPPGVDMTNQKINFSESFGDSTSVWDSIQSAEDAEILRHANDPVALEKVRENVSLELLWIQQAIDSRKNYLKLKKKLAGQDKMD
ncbi:uncharacterized protein LOC135503135 [Lineus longissimus]|uniref:uncharacterized protein LOC135503135 n=1 Tax=Lineus longissimus TaxID=88925 RepID=UPI002B4E1034